LGTTIAKHAPKLIESGITLLGKLAAGLISAIPDLLAKIPSLIKQIKEKFSSVNWGEIGLNVVKGIAKGLTNALSEIGKAAKKLASSLMNSLKEKLGIHSPSVQAEKIIGKNVNLGVAKGVRKNVSPVVDSMRDMGREMLGTLDTDFSYNMSGFGNMYSSGSETYGKMEQLYELLDRYLPQLANMKMVTDTGALVGELMPKTNLGLNEIMTLSERGM
jgi:hypothetical protein